MTIGLGNVPDCLDGNNSNELVWARMGTDYPTKRPLAGRSEEVLSQHLAESHRFKMGTGVVTGRSGKASSGRPIRK